MSIQHKISSCPKVLYTLSKYVIPMKMASELLHPCRKVKINLVMDLGGTPELNTA